MLWSVWLWGMQWRTSREGEDRQNQAQPGVRMDNVVGEPREKEKQWNNSFVDRMSPSSTSRPLQVPGTSTDWNDSLLARSLWSISPARSQNRSWIALQTLLLGRKMAEWHLDAAWHYSVAIRTKFENDHRISSCAGVIYKWDHKNYLLGLFLETWEAMPFIAGRWNLRFWQLTFTSSTIQPRAVTSEASTVSTTTLSSPWYQQQSFHHPVSD